MELKSMYEQIDKIDGEMLRLFDERMHLCADMAKAQGAAGQPVSDPAGERKKLAEIRRMAGEELGGYAGVLYSSVLDLARSYRDSVTGVESPVSGEIAASLQKTPKLFPESGLIACQGVEGAYSQMAAEKLFTRPDILYFNSFEGVFAAVDKGLCDYGVLPLENSTAGSVNAIYDLMMNYHFYIVRATRLKIDHSLLAKKGARLENIREIYSHEQAIGQCGALLKSLGDVKITPCENTATAAKLVAQSQRDDVAALSSHACAKLYGLGELASSVQDKSNNHTRFICISKKPEIYPGADKTSIMLTVSHRPGSLYKVIARINALNINLTKLESRPIPERDFEFMFYFDLDASVYSPGFAELMGKIDTLCESFQYLGSYTETV